MLDVRKTILCCLSKMRVVGQRNFETNMFGFGTAYSIVVRSLATWSAFGCWRNVIAIFLFSEWLIYGMPPSHPSTTMEVFLFYMWYILIENFALNFFFFDMFKKDYCNVRKVTAALQVVKFFNRFSLQDGSLLHYKKSDCRPARSHIN